ncbi:MAG: ABC transporter permease [Acetobacter cibinongensis]
MDTLQASHPSGPILPQPSGPEPVLHLEPEHGFACFRHAWHDFMEGLTLGKLACTLSWLDIKQRYRGSLLGPFWLTLSATIMVAAMGLLYSYLLHMDVHVYLPFLTISLVIWMFVSGLMTESCTTFNTAASMIHAARLPYSLHIIRSTVRNWMVCAHNVPVVVVVFLWFHTTPHWTWALLAALVVWGVDSFFLTLFLAILGARFRDIPPIMASILQILFFVTPVIWAPELMSVGEEWLLLDPFFPLIEILRGPLTGDHLSVMVWPAALLWSALLGVITCTLFARMRARLAYWV